MHEADQINLQFGVEGVRGMVTTSLAASLSVVDSTQLWQACKKATFVYPLYIPIKIFLIYLSKKIKINNGKDEC